MTKNKEYELTYIEELVARDTIKNHMFAYVDGKKYEELFYTHALDVNPWAQMVGWIRTGLKADGHGNIVFVANNIRIDNSV